MRSCALACLLALPLLASVGGAHGAHPCIMPHYADGPPGAPAADKCTRDSECCGELKCGTDGRCGPGATPEEKMSATEHAYVAHLVLADCMDHTTALALDLDSANQAIANASKALKRAAARAGERVAAAADASAEKAHNISAKIREKRDKLRARAAEKKADAKQGISHGAAKTEKGMDALNRKAHSVINNVTARISSMKASQPAGGAGGFDKYYKGYASGGAAGGPDAASSDKKHGKKSKKTDSKKDAGQGASGSFDYSKYMGGAGGGADSKSSSKKTTKDSADKSSAGGGAGFDYSKFMPGGDSKLVNMAAEKTPAGGFDYSKYSAGGGAGGKGDSKKSKSSKKKKAAGGQGAGPGFDYSKYTGSKLLSMAAADTGFDWHKFVPDMSTNGTTQPPLHEHKKPGPHHKPAGHPAPAGHGKHVKPAAQQEAPAAEVRVGGAEPPHSGAEKPKSPATKGRQGAGKSAVVMQQNGDDASSGKGNKDGEPCGATPYKDFGACKKGLKCDTHPLFTAFAPGKCIAHPSDKADNRRRVLADAAAAAADDVDTGADDVDTADDDDVDAADDDDVDAADDDVDTADDDMDAVDDVDADGDVDAVDDDDAKTPLRVPGSEGGPCGAWALGSMDFGACKAGLTCTQQVDVKVVFFGENYTLPSLCRADGAVSMIAWPWSSADDDAPVTEEDDVDATYADLDDAVDKAAASAKAAAKKASEAAQRAADQAELLAHKLLAAAARARAAAEELMNEAANATAAKGHGRAHADDGDDDDHVAVTNGTTRASTSMLEVPMEMARSSYWMFSLAGIGAAAVAVLWQKWSGDGHSYRRL